MSDARDSEDIKQVARINTDMLTQVTKELQILNKHRYIRMHNSAFRLVMFNFIRGLAFGLGSVIGATVLLSVLVYWLAQFEWLPVIGDWLGELKDQIDPRNIEH